MGNLLDVVPEGWRTMVKDVLREAINNMRLIAQFTLEELKHVAIHIGRKMSIEGEEDGGRIVTKELIKQFLTPAFSRLWDRAANLVTSKKFLELCGEVILAIANIAGSSSTSIKALLLEAIEQVVTKICSESTSPIVNEIFKRALKLAKEKLAKKAAGSAWNNAVTSGVATVKTVGENASKLSKAKACARAALKSSVVVDSTLFGISTGYSYYKYTTGASTWEEHKEVVAKRSAGTVGSIGGTGAGAFVGTLIFPGVGTYVGGFVGGIAGDYVGSWFGGKVYNGSSNRPHTD